MNKRRIENRTDEWAELERELDERAARAAERNRREWEALERAARRPGIVRDILQAPCAGSAMLRSYGAHKARGAAMLDRVRQVWRRMDREAAALGLAIVGALAGVALGAELVGRFCRAFGVGP